MRPHARTERCVDAQACQEFDLANVRLALRKTCQELVGHRGATVLELVPSPKLARRLRWRCEVPVTLARPRHDEADARLLDLVILLPLTVRPHEGRGLMIGEDADTHRPDDWEETREKIK